MVRPLFRGLLIGGVMATVGVVCVGESRAFFGLCNKCQPTTAMSPVCNPQAQQMTCNYVPQTSYRVQYVSVPVTTYRPLMTCDPCGCQTTSMRAETTYVQRAQYVPYTSYKMVYTMPRPACATTAYYAPPAAVAAPAGCSTCGVAGATQATYYGPTAVGATTVAPQPIVAPQVSAPVTVNYTPNYAYANGYGVSSAMPTIPSAQPTIPTPGAVYAPVQRVVVPPPPTTVVTPGASSAAPTYSGQTYVSPNGGAMIQPSLPTTTTSYYAAPGQSAIVNGQPLQTQIIQSAPPVGQTQIIQSSPSPTPAPPTVAPPTIVHKPAEVETKIETKMETKVDAESTDRMQPIPDPLLNNPSGTSGQNMNKTSTPRLYDPQDKTAAAWPIERAWGYSAVAMTVAAKPEAPVVLTSAIVPGTINSANSAPIANVDRNPTTLGAIVPSTQPAIQPMLQPLTQQPLPVTRTRDADGWGSSSR